MRHILTYGGIFLNGTKKETATVGEKNHMGLNGLSVPASKKVENVCVCGGGAGWPVSGDLVRFVGKTDRGWGKTAGGGGKPAGVGMGASGAGCARGVLSYEGARVWNNAAIDIWNAPRPTD
jgi:hypothetical protein